MTLRTLTRVAAGLALALVCSAASAQDVIRLRIASGHPPANTYVNLMQNFFVPEVTKRVAAKTKHKVEFVEGYGGAMVKVADTLEGVQSGIIDIGGYLLLLRAVEPAAARVPGHAAVRHHGPGDEPQGRARRVRQGAVHVEGVRGQVPAEADRADRRQRLQPRHHLRVEQGRRPQGRRSSPAPASI